MSELRLNITNFEGPFDLLLHLIRANKMQIRDVRISEITSQYIAYLNEMNELDMEIASEFLVIAATLIEIKSRELLPRNIEPEDEEDIKEKLVLRIEEYEAFKLIAEELAERFGRDIWIFTKMPETIEAEEVSVSELLKGLTMEKLHKTYVDLMDRKKAKINKESTMAKSIEAESYRIEDKMEELERVIFAGKPLRLLDMLERSHSKYEAIVIFLAVLELARGRKVTLSQEDIFSEIIVAKGDADGDDSTDRNDTRP
ncbi:MAG: segregation/condensation protein A [Youngiibacter sp.]|nr:segregation/condensation protein A [Youngiibacter sp.]